MNKSAVKLYYWKAEFMDGFNISQFDSEGKEIMIKSFGTQYCFNRDGSVKENCNIFSDIENNHGLVKKVGWYPFSENFAKRCMTKQATLRIATSDDLKPVEQIVPDNFYSTYLKSSNRVEYSVQSNSKGTKLLPLDSVQTLLHTTIVPRDGIGEPISNVIELRYK